MCVCVRVCLRFWVSADAVASALGVMMGYTWCCSVSFGLVGYNIFFQIVFVVSQILVLVLVQKFLLCFLCESAEKVFTIREIILEITIRAYTHLPSLYFHGKNEYYCT